MLIVIAMAYQNNRLNIGLFQELVWKNEKEE